MIPWVFDTGQPQRAWCDVILWWEMRRPLYNGLVFAVGCVSLPLYLTFIIASGHLDNGGDAIEPLAIFAYPILINMAYTLGWMVEGGLHVIRVRPRPPLGPLLFKLGTGFSLLMVIMPAVFWGVICLLSVLGIIEVQPHNPPVSQ